MILISKIQKSFQEILQNQKKIFFSANEVKWSNYKLLSKFSLKLQNKCNSSVKEGTFT